jgi:DNA-3-methyladenine glycosylase I
METAVNGIVIGADGKRRCAWSRSDAAYDAYHDDEWGRPVVDDTRLFEKICLEGFQSGLSWLTILRKRENFRAAFAGFDPVKVARFGARDVQRLLSDAGIIRHRGKIESTIGNAKRAVELIDEHGSIASYVWQWEPQRKDRPAHITWESLRTITTSPASVAMSKDLKKRGWTFVGPTTIYAFMQAMGLVNDHLEGCYARKECERERKQLKRPGSP